MRSRNYSVSARGGKSRAAVGYSSAGIQQVESSMATNLETFCDSFRSVSGVPHLAASMDEAAGIIAGILRDSGAKLVALAQIPAALASRVAEHCAEAGIELLQPPYDAASLPDSLDKVNVGITGLEFGIAESGTMVELALNDAVRLVSAMPRTYIGILQADTIVPRLMDAAPRLREYFLSNEKHVTVSFISGPSRTGDIEMILTLGVHGPEHAHCILLTAER